MKTAGLLLCSLLLSACSTSTERPEPSPLAADAQRNEARANDLAATQDFSLAIEPARAALKLYHLLDDGPGRLRTNLLLVRLFLTQNDKNQAILHLDAAQRIAQQENWASADSDIQYQLALLSGRLHNRPADFQRALSLAVTPVQKAASLTYLQQYQQAYEQVADFQPADRHQQEDLAFVLFEYAQATGNHAAAEQALKLYKTTENIAGISDNLFLLGRLSERAGQRLQALRYYQRALSVNKAMGDTARTEITRQAIVRLQQANPQVDGQ